jgi:Flp pilus assembly protein TadG
VLGYLRARRANEEGASMVEFAIVVPLLLLLLCGTIDFGLIFGGDLSMQSGVASATRAISIDQYQYGGSNTCSSTGSSTTTATANAVCSIAASLGSMTGLNPSTLAIGICFVTPGSSPSCGGAAAAGNPGTSVLDDVEVCAQAQMESTTGLTSVFVSGSTVSTSSRLLVEEPQPSGATGYDSFNPTSSAVDYNGTDISGMTCT